MSYIDLHMHSDISLDGEYTPAEIAAMCEENHLEIVSLTDHNSIRGIREMKKALSPSGVRMIPGIELDCTYEELDLHVLGYGIDIEDKRYLQIEQDILSQKKASSKKTLEILLELGILFEKEDVLKLAKDGVVVGEMIAEAALADKRNENNPLLAAYRAGGSRSNNPYVNFFWDYCAQGKPAFLPIRYMSFAEAITLITKTGGIPVIAHPVNTVGRDEKIITDMVSQGIVGIESYSSYHSSDDRQYYHTLAKKLGVMETMGSDFHGKNKPSVSLGNTFGDGKEDELIKAMEMFGVL